MRLCPWQMSPVAIAALMLSAGRPARSQPRADVGFSFTNTARDAGLTAVTAYGGVKTNKYLLETTGCGVALFDYDGDGWLDVFLVNGSRLEGFPDG